LVQHKELLVVQMLVDDIGDVTITNDGATILKLLEVEHPAAKASQARSSNISAQLQQQGALLLVRFWSNSAWLPADTSRACRTARPGSW